MAEEEDEHMVSVIIEVEDELVKTMKTRLKALDSAPANEEPCTIYRVIHSVRDEHKEDYDPKIISIGPFHRDKESLKPMELLKWRYLQDLLQRSQEENMLEKYIKKVRELEARARKKYAEVVEPDSNAFVQMMVVDGCFIIELLIELYFYYEDRNRCQLEAVNWNLPLLRNDLLMLENQIPFFVLESLFELSNLSDLLDPEEDEDTPVTFMKLAVSYVTRDKFESLPVDKKNVHHLLHLFQISLRPTPDEGKPTACLCGDAMMLIFMKMRSLASGAFFWLMSLFLCCRLPLRCWEGRRNTLNKERSRAPRVIPSATELKGCGVKFKKNDNALSFLDVTFRDGVMEIPVLAIQEGTPPFFRNLIAFEQCCPTAGSHFTSYAVLLDNLIDTAGDVVILKDCGIFESKLGQDEEVAILFNKLCKGAYLDYEKHYLVKLFKDVEQYSEVDLHKWRAGLMHNYFGNPWAIISLIAAIFLLSLTVVQTFFSVYAYYRPPN